MSEDRSKRASKRLKKKARKQELRLQEQAIRQKLVVELEDRNSASNELDNQPNIVYVPESLDESEPLYSDFKEVLEHFAASGAPSIVQEEDQKVNLDSADAILDRENREGFQSGDEEEEEEKIQLSNKKRKKLVRMSVSELKQLVARPDLVDVHDCNSTEPVLLVHLKGYRNTVPVPAHWSQKRGYLQGKRGFVKPPFKLPKFIEETGIAQIRDSQLSVDDEKSLKQKQREKMHPKMGRLNIEYQVLHDAFFKHQVKPELSRFGELYYEGKEFQVKTITKVPGKISRNLRLALGIRENDPFPWLFNMQRVGPPPSYRTLRIPGLNAPIPPGASYGFGDGQWGKPPVDQFGNPIYGDPFGVWVDEKQTEISSLEDEDRNYWGQIFETNEEDVEAPTYHHEQQQPSQDIEEGEELPYLEALGRLRNGIETESDSGIDSSFSFA